MTKKYLIGLIVAIGCLAGGLVGQAATVKTDPGLTKFVTTYGAAYASGQAVNTALARFSQDMSTLSSPTAPAAGLRIIDQALTEIGGALTSIKKMQQTIVPKLKTAAKPIKDKTTRNAASVLADDVAALYQAMNKVMTETKTMLQTIKTVAQLQSRGVTDQTKFAGSIAKIKTITDQLTADSAVLTAAGKKLDSDATAFDALTSLILAGSTAPATNIPPTNQTSAVGNLNSACPTGLQACGPGCIPTNAICCDSNGVNSYCLQPTKGCGQGSCYTCPAGQAHCGMTCVASGSQCCFGGVCGASVVPTNNQPINQTPSASGSTKYNGVLTLTVDEHYADSNISFQSHINTTINFSATFDTAPSDGSVASFAADAPFSYACNRTIYGAGNLADSLSYSGGLVDHNGTLVASLGSNYKYFQNPKCLGYTTDPSGLANKVLGNMDKPTFALTGGTVPISGTYTESSGDDVFTYSGSMTLTPTR